MSDMLEPPRVRSTSVPRAFQTRWEGSQELADRAVQGLVICPGVFFISWNVEKAARLSLEAWVPCGDELQEMTKRPLVVNSLLAPAFVAAMPCNQMLPLWKGELGQRLKLAVV